MKIHFDDLAKPDSPLNIREGAGWIETRVFNTRNVLYAEPSFSQFLNEHNITIKFLDREVDLISGYLFEFCGDEKTLLEMQMRWF